MKHLNLQKTIDNAIKLGMFTSPNGRAIVHFCNSFSMANEWAGTAKIIITDPPYEISSGGNNLTKNVIPTNVPNKGVMADYNNNGKPVFCETNWPEIMQLLFLIAAENSEILVFSNTSCFTQSSQAAKQAGFKEHNFKIWQKVRMMPTKYGMKAFEPIHYLYKGKARDVNHPSRSNILTYLLRQGTRVSDHRTEKPIDLLIDLITMHSNEDDIIVDPFLGSGTTAAAALRTNRRFMGAEIIKKYFTTSIKRILNQPPVTQPGQLSIFDIQGE